MIGFGRYLTVYPCAPTRKKTGLTSRSIVSPLCRPPKKKNINQELLAVLNFACTDFTRTATRNSELCAVSMQWRCRRSFHGCKLGSCQPLESKIGLQRWLATPQNWNRSFENNRRTVSLHYHSQYPFEFQIFVFGRMSLKHWKLSKIVKLLKFGKKQCD